MRIALVHDWLTGMRGGERCLEVLCELFPGAPLYTLVHERGRVSPVIEDRQIHTSALQRVGCLRRRYRHALPLLPRLMESFDFSGYDLIISSSHCVAKLARTPPGARHWCYIYTPMRYVWDLFGQYFGPQAHPLVRLAARIVAPGLRRKDRESSSHVGQFVAISNFVAARVQRHYGRQAQVIYPPVSLERFHPVSPSEVGDWDLVVSAFAPYKGIDLVIEAANRSGRRLKIIGSGQMERRLRSMAGPSVEFLGALDDAQVSWHMARCRSFIFPGVEDFGITPLEAQASGRPVVALAAGGTLETVEEGVGGVLFKEANAASLLDALGRCDRLDWNAARAVASVQRFGRERFKEEVKASIESYCPGAFTPPRS